MTQLQRGRCPVCDRDMVLKADGTLRHHGGPVGTGSQLYPHTRAYCCDGVGQVPVQREQPVQLAPGMAEPDWDSEDFDLWGDEADWHPSWFPKAKAALIRHFSHVDVRVAYLGGGKFSVKVPGSGAREMRLDYVQEFLDGFLRGCELMAEQWDCRERAEEVQS